MVRIGSILQKGSCVEVVVPNTVLRSRDLGKWLNPEGAHLINGLIPWWIHNLMALLEVMEIRRWVLFRGSSHWRCAHEGYTFASVFLHSLLLLPIYHEVSSFPLPCPVTMMFCLTISDPWQWSQPIITMNGNLCNCDPRSVFSSLSCFLWLFCHGSRKLTNTVTGISHWISSPPISFTKTAFQPLLMALTQGSPKKAQVSQLSHNFFPMNYEPE
jgi:hypothetical protein